jgi:hypothetical protein
VSGGRHFPHGCAEVTKAAIISLVHFKWGATAWALLVRLPNIDIDANELPFAIRHDEGEVIVHAVRSRVEVALKRQPSGVIDLRLLNRDRRLGGDQLDIDVLVAEILERLGELIGRDLIAERLRELGVKDIVIVSDVGVIEGRTATGMCFIESPQTRGTSE